MFENFQWPRPEQEADEILIRNVREHGCHILGVDDRPPFTFSIGLALNYGQPEIIIVGIASNQAAQMINIVRDEAAKGKIYADGEVSSDILVNGNVCFVEVPLRRYDEYLGTAIWFYRKSPRPFPCLQMVWPDRAGLFPWDAECNPAFKRDQPILKALS
jgi:Domain of unknown function (DUF4262)